MTLDQLREQAAGGTPEDRRHLLQNGAAFAAMTIQNGTDGAERAWGAWVAEWGRRHGAAIRVSRERGQALSLDAMAGIRDRWGVMAAQGGPDGRAEVFYLADDVHDDVLAAVLAHEIGHALQWLDGSHGFSVPPKLMTTDRILWLETDAWRRAIAILRDCGIPWTTNMRLALRHSLGTYYSALAPGRILS